MNFTNNHLDSARTFIEPRNFESLWRKLSLPQCSRWMVWAGLWESSIPGPNHYNSARTGSKWMPKGYTYIKS